MAEPYRRIVEAFARLSPKHVAIGVLLVGLSPPVLVQWQRWYTPAIRSPETPAAPTLSVGAIHAGVVFGTVPDAAPAVAAELTVSDVTLSGTLAFADAPQRGLAIVTAAGATHLFRVGDPVGGGQLLEVYADHIVLDRSGQRVAVYLPKAAAGHGGLYGNDLSGGSDRPPPGPALADPPVDVLKARIAKATAPLASLFHAEALLSDDEYRGLVVRPNGNAYLFGGSGLQADDVLMAVNGIALTQDNLNLLADEMRTGKPVKVSLMRPGVGMMDVTLRASGAFVAPP